MTDSITRNTTMARVVLWIARLSAIAVIVPVMLMVFGEPGPTGVRAWVYLALVPFGFSAGYLLGWRWAILGGSLALACMAASLLVTGRTFGLGPYLIWGLLCIPGVLYILAGLQLRRAANHAVSGGS